MPEYFGRIWWKARTGLPSLMRKHGLTFADIGFLMVLYDASKEDLSDGYLTLTEVAKLASNGRLRGWKQSLERLSKTDRLDLFEDHVELDWRGQQLRSQVEKKGAPTLANGKPDYAARCAAGDHTLCRKRGTEDDCPKATKWAKSVAKDHGDDHGDDHGENPLLESEKRRAIKSSDSELTKTDGSATPPGQRSDAGAPTLPGPSFEDEKGAPTSAPNESAPEPSASTEWNWDEVY